MPPSSHDALFRLLFGDAAIARDVIASALPPDVRAALDLSALEPRPTAQIDAAMHAFQSDLVFAAKIAGRDALVLVLVEHQSRRDAHMPFRLLQYAVLLWDAYLRDHPQARQFPLVVPIVVHQGRRAWGAPRDMLSMMDLTPEEASVLGRYVPRMGMEIDDLTQMDDAALLARNMGAEAMLALSALRDVRDARDVYALVARWGHLLRAASATAPGARAIPAILRYIVRVHDGIRIERLVEIADRAIAGTGAETMTTFRELMQRGRTEGEIEGKRAGKIAGKIEGRLATLQRQVRLKFGEAASETIVSRLQAADAETLERVTDRILTAASVDELFA